MHNPPHIRADDRAAQNRPAFGLARKWANGFALLAVALALFACRRPDSAEVVVYCAQDQAYAEPILNDFARETGIRVKPVFDSEAVKTVGLANRLLAERQQAQCDVFWGNEELRTRMLEAQGVFTNQHLWRAVGYRSRRIVVNTNLLSLSKAPRSLMELTNPAWQRKVALAYPLFGTTATHFAALRQAWGDERWEQWCRDLAANKPFVVDGNSVVVKLVGRGEAWIGLTDSDDIAAGQREGLPVAALPLDSESLLIPNTIAITSNAPHPIAARQLMDYLQARAVLDRLVKAGALEGASAKEITVATLTPDWHALIRDLETTTASLKGTFLR